MLKIGAVNSLKGLSIATHAGTSDNAPARNKMLFDHNNL